MRRAHRQENETFLLIKAMCINNLLKIKWEPRVTIQGGIQTHCSQNQEDYDNVTDQIFRSHDETCETQRWVSLKSCRVLLEDCSDVSAAPSWPGSPSPVCVCIPAKVHSRKKNPSELKDLPGWMRDTVTLSVNTNILVTQLVNESLSQWLTSCK